MNRSNKNDLEYQQKMMLMRYREECDILQKKCKVTQIRNNWNRSRYQFIPKKKEKSMPQLKQATQN